MKAALKNTTVDAYQWYPPEDNRHDKENTKVTEPLFRFLHNPTGSIVQIQDIYFIYIDRNLYRLYPTNWILYDSKGNPSVMTGSDFIDQYDLTQGKT